MAAAIGPVTLGFSTYDGSGQVVHPDVVVFDQPWNGHKLWNAITPYPNSAVQFENPSLFASDDGDTWGVPEGVLNPLSKTTRGYLSDPDMLFEPKSNEMWLYYREVHNVLIRKGVTAHLADHVWLTTSSDAVHWSSPKRVTTDSGHFMVSPSIVRTSENNWAMYQIDAGRGGCSATSTKIVRRQSVDGRAWSRPVAVSFTQAGYTPWHLDVQYIPSKHEYWALVAAYRPARGCTTTSLFFATSSDGTNWTTYPTPVLAAGEIAQFGSAVYRSTFAYEGDTDNLTIWYSGCKVVRPAARSKAAVLAWSAAVTHTTATILMSRVNDNSLTITLSVAATPGTSLMSASNVP
ncbi:MAG: sialidase family protein [Gemmatimonas sp.]